MIETHAIQFDDIGVATDVFVVAHAAAAFRHARFATVKAALEFQIFGDGFVTIDAQLRLPSAVRAIVALSAILFQFCMRKR